LDQFIQIYGSNYTKITNNLEIDIGDEKIMYSYTWKTANNYLYLIEHIGLKWSEKQYPGKFPLTSRYSYYEVEFVKRNLTERKKELIDKEKKRINTEIFDEGLNNF
jgi:hypothetical protein